MIRESGAAISNRKINERPVVAVCICSKSGTIIRHDPGLYMRTLREQYARATNKEEDREDDDG